MIKSLEEDMSLLEVRRQVVYVPGHLREGFLEDTAGYVAADVGVERGFITGWNEGGVFCRYFLAGFELSLRTTANSERAKIRDVFPYEHTRDWVIEGVWNTYVEPIEGSE